MKRTSVCLVAVLMLVSTAQAIVLLSTNYIDDYTQTTAGVARSWQGVSAFIYLGAEYPEDTAESAVAFRPDGSEMNLVGSAPNPVLPSFFWLDGYYPPQEAPTGDYTFAFTGGTRDGTTEIVTIDPSGLPPIAELTNGSFRSLSDSDVSKPIRLNFKPQPGHVQVATDPGSDLTTRLDISNERGETVFSVAPFDPATSLVVIPAGTLKPATKYWYLLSYTSAHYGEPVFNVKFRNLEFTFVTAAAKSQ